VTARPIIGESPINMPDNDPHFTTTKEASR